MHTTYLIIKIHIINEVTKLPWKLCLGAWWQIYKIFFFSQINLQNLYFKMLFLFEPIWSTERIRNDRIRELDKDRIWYTCMIKSYSIICLLYTNNKLDNEMIEYKFYLNDKITLVIELHKITLHVYFLFFFYF